MEATLSNTSSLRDEGERKLPSLANNTQKSANSLVLYHSMLDCGDPHDIVFLNYSRGRHSDYLREERLGKGYN